jgi:hypothetical protein
MVKVNPGGLPMKLISISSRRASRDAVAILTLAAVFAPLQLLGPDGLLAAPPEPLASFSLPGNLGSFPAAGNQDDPAIARGDDQYLVAWTDDRTSLFDASGNSGSARDVYAARLDAGGNLIDTTPIVISQRPHDQYDPSVFWNGSQWLVTWTGTIPYGPLYTHRIEAARVSAAGEVLDSEPIVVYAGGNSEDDLMGAASNGQDWALVFSETYQDGFNTRVRLVGKRVTPSGAVLSAPYYLFNPSCCYYFFRGGLAYVNGVYMAVFEGYVDSFNYGIFGVRMSDNLQTLDSYPLTLTQIAMQGETHFYSTPNIASDGNLFFVGWQLYNTADNTSQIYGARVDASGQSQDGNGFPISAPLPLQLFFQPQLAYDGSQWLVGWDDGGLNMARVNISGNVLDPGGIDLQLPYGSLAGSGAGGVQAVWSEARVTGPMPLDAFTAHISSSLVVGPDACVALGAPSQTQADLAAGSTGQLLVYRSAISGEQRILAHPLDSSGQALTSEPIPLAAGDVDAPRVAFDGDNYLVVWSNGAGAVLGRRVAQDGTVLDAAPIAVLSGAAPDVAGRSGQFVVAATHGGGAYAARVGGDGVVIDTPPLLLRTPVTGGPRAASLGTYWVIAYEYTATADGSEVEMALVDGGGGVLGPFAVSSVGDGIAAHRPAITAGDMALIVWQDARAGADDLNLYGRRFSANITFADPASGLAVLTADGNQSGAALAWDGAQFLTDFTDDRNVVNSIDVRTDIYRGWVPTSGPVPEPAGLPLYMDSVPEIDAAVSALDGNSLYAASVFDSGSPYTAYRIRLRFAGLPSAVGDQGGPVARATRLLASYPNPANPGVQIQFVLGQPGTATVEIFNVRGARVRTLRAASLPAGEHELRWDGKDDLGRPTPSGTYLYRLRAAGVVDQGKLMLVQ